MSVLISVEGLSKRYRLGSINRGMLYKDLQSWLARRFGKEDPHARISDKSSIPRRIVNGDEFWALRDINLSINAGDTVAIIGRNGAGKSTLLKILSRITAPTTGVVKTRGRIASLLEVGTGFHGELTGRENIFLNGAILGMTRMEVNARLDEIIAFAEIEDFIDTPVKRYSSGMFVRLAFAVAAHLEPEVLIVDEVLAVGDMRFQKKCLGKMSEASEKEGRTVIFVSHNMAAVQRLCARAIIVDQGNMIADGPIGESLLKYFQLNGSVSETMATRRFSREHSIPGAVVYVEEVSIRNASGEECVNCTIEDSFSIEMIYKIDEVSDECHVPTYQLNTSDGSCAFVAAAPDISILPPGRYRAVLQIDGGFMNADAYSIDISVISHNLEKGTYTISMYERGTMSLAVTESEYSPRRYCYAGLMPGAVRPSFPWVITQLN